MLVHSADNMCLVFVCFALVSTKPYLTMLTHVQRAKMSDCSQLLSFSNIKINVIKHKALSIAFVLDFDMNIFINFCVDLSGLNTIYNSPERIYHDEHDWQLYHFYKWGLIFWQSKKKSTSHIYFDWFIFYSFNKFIVYKWNICFVNLITRNALTMSHAPE